jgi:hypothetical protein
MTDQAPQNYPKIARVDYIQAPMFLYARFSNGSTLPAALIAVSYGEDGAPLGTRVMCVASDGQLYPAHEDLGFEYLFVDHEDMKDSMLRPTLVQKDGAEIPQTNLTPGSE